MTNTQNDFSGVRTALGTELTSEDQAEVLRSFVNRFTGEHRPNWAAGRARAQYPTDAIWLAHTRFGVKKNGRLDHRVKRCESAPYTSPREKVLRDLVLAQMHESADEALCWFLRQLGHGDVADAFERVPKWYS